MPNPKLQKIVEEVFDLRGTHDVFEFIQPDMDKNYSNLNNRLGEILTTLTQYEPIEVAMYLRSSYGVKDALSHWEPLLNRGIEWCKMNGQNMDMFIGMVPKQEVQFPFK